MNAIVPASAAAGTTVCITVTGSKGTVGASARLGDDEIPVTLIEEPSGIVRIKFSTPPDTVGFVELVIGDNGDARGSESHFIGVAP